MIKSLVLSISLAAGLALAFPAAAAVLDQPMTFDLLQPAPDLAPADGCTVPLTNADMLFVEATEGSDQFMAELTGLCLVPVPAPATVALSLAANAHPLGSSPSCTSIRASPD